MRRYLGAILTALPCATGAGAQGHDWQIQTVDSTGNVGWWNSMALDFDGCPRISYSSYNGFDLKHALWTGSEWLIETVDSISASGGYTALAVDRADRSHVSFYQYYYKDLKYARRDTSGWWVETVDSTDDVGRYTSLALDSMGRPCISYTDEPNVDLKYARWNGAAWEFEVADNTGGQFTSLALDSRDCPHVCYYDSINCNLKYAYRDSAGWQNEAVDYVGDLADITTTDIVLDDSDRPHVSYYRYADSTGQMVVDLKYAHRDSSDWQVEFVDTTGSLGKYSSIVLDDSGRPRISFRDSSNDDLKYAVRNGTEWEIEVVDTTGGGPNSLVLDDSGRVHISYYISSVDDLKYAVGTPRTGIQERPGPAPPDVRPFVSRHSTFGILGCPGLLCGSARIRYTVVRPGRVRLGVYNPAGRLVRILVDGLQPAGEHVTQWDGRGDSGSRLPAGVYFARLSSDDRVETRMLLLVR